MAEQFRTNHNLTKSAYSEKQEAKKVAVALANKREYHHMYSHLTYFQAY